MVATIDQRLDALEDRVTVLEDKLNHKPRPAFGVTIEDARARLNQPVERGPEVLELFQRIVGCFEGPEDLSSRMREYLYGERE